MNKNNYTAAKFATQESAWIDQKYKISQSESRKEPVGLRLKNIRLGTQDVGDRSCKSLKHNLGEKTWDPRAEPTFYWFYSLCSLCPSVHSPLK